jgi:hypothetical protein
VLAISACSDSKGPTADDATVAGDGGPNDVAGYDQGLGDSALVCPPADAAPAGSCAAEALVPFAGKHPLVMRELAIGTNEEGFDLNNADCDYNIKTGVDNILWPIGAVAKQPLAEAMANGEVVIPFEFYDLDDLVNDDCLSFSIYLGVFPIDADQDGSGVGGPVNKGKDCNDHDPAIGHKIKEVPGNGVDDDCDGLADEDETTTPATPGSDTTDADGDGQSIAAGDCDDRPGVGTSSKKGGKEICGDGLDNDCNGKADDGCLPWTEGMVFGLDPASLSSAKDAALVSFRGARLKDGHLVAGPSIFSLSIAISSNQFFELNLSNVYVEADIKPVAGTFELVNGMLSGVVSGKDMDLAPNLLAELGVGGSPDDSLLDVLAGPAGQLLGLPTDAKGNRIPDVDVDGDGIEHFEDHDLDGDTATFRVDTCIDGDGTIIQDKYDQDGKVIERCTSAKDKNGKFRFVDGWSIAIKFGAVPAAFKGVVEK